MNIFQWELSAVKESFEKSRRTCNAAQESQVGRIARVLIHHALPDGAGQRYGQRDGLVEFPATWLHRDDRTDRHAVAQQTGHHVGGNDVGLHPDLDLLGQGALGEEGLHVVFHGGGDDAAVRSDRVHLLFDAGDDGKVEWEVGGEDAHNPVGLEVFDGA